MSSPSNQCDTCGGLGTLKDCTVKPAVDVLCEECKGTGRKRRMSRMVFGNAPPWSTILMERRLIHRRRRMRIHAKPASQWMGRPEIEEPCEDLEDLVIDSDGESGESDRD